MPEAIARHDTLARAAVGDHRGTVVKTTGDGLHAVFGDAARWVARRARDRARARRPRGDGRRRAARPVRAPHRRHRAPRQRLFRQHGQPRGAHHVRRARRPDPAFASGRRGDPRAAAAGRDAARPGPRATARPREPRARLPGRASGAAAGFPGAALARIDAEQSAAAGDVVRRSRARTGRSATAARRHAAAYAARDGRTRQDATVAAGRRRRARRLSRRRLVRRARARSPTRGSCRRPSRRCWA